MAELRCDSCAPTNTRPLRRCRKCGGDWDLEACYRKKNDPRSRPSASGLTYHSVCKMCDTTERNDPTPEERARRKAQATIGTHAQKRDMKPPEFAKRYRWDIERMVYDILHGHENTCPYCWEFFSSMGNGLSDITLDIVNRDEEPYYQTNTRWCCATCNREKASMPAHLWAILLASWAEWAARKEAITRNPTFGLPLFAAMGLLTLLLFVIPG